MCGNSKGFKPGMYICVQIALRQVNICSCNNTVIKSERLNYSVQTAVFIASNLWKYIHGNYIQNHDVILWIDPVIKLDLEKLKVRELKLMNIHGLFEKPPQPDKKSFRSGWNFRIF